MTTNQRREKRIDACLPVTVVRGRTTTTLETADVSFKGLFLRTAEPPPLRSLMRLKVSLPLREIEAHAMAVHLGDAEEPGVGVQFWGLAGPDRVAWEDYVREQIQLRMAAAKRRAAEEAADARAAGETDSGVRATAALPAPKVSAK